MSLIAHWRMDGNYENTVDNKITLTNPSGDSSQVVGVIGNAETKTTGYYLTNLSQIPNDFSVALWYRHNGVNWLSECIFGTRTGSNGFMFYRNDGDGDGYHRIYFWYVNTLGSIVGWNAWPGVSGLSADRWYHITLTRTYDGYLKVYVDGSVAYSGAPPADFAYWHNNGANLAFHAQGNGSGYTSGDVSYDDIRVYDHTLSIKEVKELSRAQVLHYDFNDFHEPTYNEFNYSKLGTGGSSLQSGVYDAFGTLDNPVYRAQGKIRFGNISGTDVDTLWYGRTYTFSIYLRKVQSLEAQTAMEFDIVDRSDSYSFTGNLADNLTNSWKRFSVTAYHNNSTLYHFVDIGQNASTGYFEWCCPQIEEKDHATPYAPPQTGRNGIVFDASGQDNHAFMAGEQDFIVNLSSASATVVGNSVTKNTTTSSWDTGATSLQSFDSDCFVEWTMDYVNEAINTQGAEMVGLNTDHSTWSYTDIDFAIYTHTNGNISVYEDGANRGVFSTWDRSERNIFRVESLNGKVYYYHNGNLIYTSTVAPTYPLYVDMSLHSHGAANTVKNIRCGYLPRTDKAPGFVAGKLSNSLNFDGTTYIDVWGHNLPSGNDPFTVACWYKLNAIPASRIDLWSWGDATATNYNAMDIYAGAVSWYNYSNDPDDYLFSHAVDTWYHVAVTYDGTILKIYHNGSLVVTDNTWAATPNVSPNTRLSIGRDWGRNTAYWDGQIDDFRVYSVPLEQADVTDLYQTRASIDSNGSLSTNKLNEISHKPLLLNYTTWEDGQSGSIGQFSVNGSTTESYRVLEEDPWGKIVPVWEARPDATSGADGGWNSSNIAIDNTKMYRFSTWMRRPEIGNGSYYLGTYGRNSAGTNEGVLNRSNGIVNTNPYFTSGGWGFSRDRWVLMVGHVWPAGSGTGSVYVDTGIYDTSGNKIATPGDFVWQSTNTQCTHRSYLYYSTDVNTRQQWVYPRVDVVDGSEPSIADLLSGFDSRNFDYVKAKGATGSLSLDIGDNETKTAELSELGPTRGLVGYYPLAYDTKDYADVNDGTIVGSVTVSDRGYLFDGTTGYIDIGDTAEIDAIGGTNNITVSAWVYYNAYGSNNGQTYSVITMKGTPWTWLLENPSNTLRFRITAGGVDTNIADTSTHNLNEWIHVAGTYDGATMKVYVNGVLKNSKAQTGTLGVSNATAKIGTYTSTSYNLNGKISDIRIYNTTLSDAEVAQLYDITNPISINRIKKTSENIYVKAQVREV